MGAFMDWVGIVLLIIPVFLPIVQRMPIDEIGLIGHLEPQYVAVWFGVPFLHEYAGEFPLSTIRTSRILSEIGGASPHLADRHIQGISTLYRRSAFGPGSLVNLAVHCDPAALRENIRVFGQTRACA